MASDKLSDRLKSMMLLDATTASSTSIDHSDALGSSSASPRRRRPLIEVVRNDDEKKMDDGEHSKLSSQTNGEDDDDDDDDDDDAPPPIYFNGAPSNAGETQSPSNSPSATTALAPSTSNANANDAPPQPSLAEQLLADAASAKQKERKRRTRKEQIGAKKSTFGLKKGFLNSSSGSGKKKKEGGKQSQEADRISKSNSTKRDNTDALKRKGEGSNLVYELDSDGNMIPSAPSMHSQENNQQLPNSDPLHLPEVQSAMLNHLQSSSSQWATSDLLDSIPRNHPKLARGMNNPRYTRELQNMQSNPKETLERLKKDGPEIVEWLMEFSGVMGEHFTRLGEKQEKSSEGGKKKDVVAAAAAAAAANDAKVREMGTLEKKALEKHRKQKANENNGTSSNQKNDKKKPKPKQPKKNDQRPNPTNDMDDQVASVLGNDELRSILLDPRMQQIMEECSSQAGKLRYYMGHEEYGPKLRKLMEAGLIRMG